MPNEPTIINKPFLSSSQTASLSGGRGDGWLVEWLQSPFIFLLLCVMGALPLVFTAMPPLTDLGGHLGRYAVQVDGGASATLRQWYSYQWSLSPNLGVDLLMQVLAPLVGLEPALKLIVTAIPVLQIAGWLLLARAAHGYVPPTALFALPLAYGYPFHFGFLNFTLCVALATCFLALWVELGNRERPDWRGPRLRWWIFGPLSCVLWVTHLAGWAVFCVFAAAHEFWRFRLKGLDKSTGPTFRHAALRSLLLLSCLLTPWMFKLLWPGASSAHGETKEFFNVGHKLSYPFMALRDRWAVWDITSALVILAVIGWSWKSRWFARNGGLALGTVALALLYFVLPGRMLGSALADMRLVPTVLAMGLIATRLRPGSDRHLVNGLAIAGLIFAGARLAGNSVSLALFDRQFSDDLAVLGAVPPNSQVVSFITEPCHPMWWPWNRERRGHLGGYAIERYHDFSNDQWLIPGGQLLQVHNRAAGEFDSDPSQITKSEVCPAKPRDKKSSDKKVEYLMTVAQRVPMAIHFMWIIENGHQRILPGWHPIKYSTSSVLYSRDYVSNRLTRSAMASRAALPI